MADLRPCPFCGGKHRLKRAAKRCAKRHGAGVRAWSKKELGLK